MKITHCYKAKPKVMQRLYFIIGFLISTVISICAQTDVKADALSPQSPTALFSHLDIATTVGSTGVGIDIATPVTPWLSVRAGASIMPRINIPFQYVFSAGDVTGGSKEDYKTDASTFTKMSDLFYSITGTKIHRGVNMDRHTMLDNVKLLFDFYPLRNKHWHATAGFYYGSRTFAYGRNIPEDAPTFVSVGFYNELYRKAVNNEPLMSSNGTEFPEDIRQKFITYGRVHVFCGKYTHDILDDNGNVVHKEGDSFYLEPDENGEMIVDARVNRFRPFLGFGYSGRMMKNDDHWRIGFEAGAMLWGGIPEVIVKRREQDMTSPTAHYYELNLMDDIRELPYYAQKEADLVNKLPVFPVLELRLSYRLF